MGSELKRETFETSRALEFFSEKELSMQIGHSKENWPIALVKELIDNALDACETAGVAPEIEMTVENDFIAVQDNGPGMPAETIERSLDYFVRVSDKNHYVSPTRGQLGNALKCVYAAPFVADGEKGKVEIIANDRHHIIDVRLDKIAQQPVINHEMNGNGFVKKGTFVKIHWAEIACYLNDEKSGDFYKCEQLINGYAAFNPHASFIFNSNHIEGTDQNWKKWKPSDPTSPHWYSIDKLTDLIAAYVHKNRSKTVREFVSEFKGLKSSAMQKKVTDAAGLSGNYLIDFFQNDDVNRDAIGELLQAMKTESKAVNPKLLGEIGKDHLFNYLISHDYAEETIKYKMITGYADDLPFIVEIAFGIANNDNIKRNVLIGLNWSPTLQNPFGYYFMSDILEDNLIESWDPVCLVLHIGCPIFNYSDRGKSKLDLPYPIRSAITGGVRLVAKAWKAAKQKQRRDQKRLHRHQMEQLKEHKKLKISAKEAAFQIMEEAYLKTSSNKKYLANARQIMYSARPLVQKITGKERPWKHSSYFTQKLLPEFEEQNSQLTYDWDVVYDARGKIMEPHTDEKIDIGTLQVRRYIDRWRDFIPTHIASYSSDCQINTVGPHNRYHNVLFVEKEGFNEIIKAARIAERFDIAIMSTKGMSPTAARHLVEELSKHDVRIFVLHDFDKAGISILNTLKSNTWRYKFEVTPHVIDLGLRLTDVQEMNLEDEEVLYNTKKYPRENLRKNGATDEECNFLVESQEGPKLWRGHRVELNAMTSDQFVNFIERKLKENGVEKVVPEEDDLKQAYDRAIKLIKIDEEIEKIRKNITTDEEYPENLKELIAEKLDDTSKAWDEVVFEIAEENLNETNK